MTAQPTIFDDARMTAAESIELTAASLREYGARHDVWSVAFSGGKDSSALLRTTVWLIETGRVPRPKKMYVLYGDTRMELPPLWLSAQATMAELGKRDWIECRVVMAAMDQRFFVYMLGRGVPPPNNNTLRWCTAQIKVEPMEAELLRLAAEVSNGSGDDLRRLRETCPDAEVRECAGLAQAVQLVPTSGQGRDSGRLLEGMHSEDRREDGQDKCGAAHLKPLMLIGVRIGESAARDARIAVACSRNGAECGQGWYQRDLPDAVCDKLSPILHMRQCTVWDWLAGNLPDFDPHVAGLGVDGLTTQQLIDRQAAWLARPPFHGFPTRMVAHAYGVDEADPTDSNARTGCLGCPLATKDVALENLVRVYPAEWGYLAPLQGLRPIYRELREPKNRLRQPPGERRKDGTLISNQNRMGPLTMEARRWALTQILAIQAEVNAAAEKLGRPTIDILNADEVARINELMAVNQWPNGWTGEEPFADELYEDQYADGSRQLLLPILPGGGT